MSIGVISGSSRWRRRDRDAQVSRNGGWKSSWQPCGLRHRGACAIPRKSFKLKHSSLKYIAEPWDDGVHGRQRGWQGMKIACLGGGPAGLYFAISMKLRDAAHDVTVSSATGRTTPSAGAWCCPTRRSPISPPMTPSARRRSATTSPIGTTSRSTTAASASSRPDTASAASGAGSCLCCCRSGRAHSA